MRNKHQTDYIAAITYLATDKDAPADIRTAANNAITAYAVAVKTASTSRTDQIASASDLDHAKTRTANQLADDLLAGKHISIDRLADKITKLETQKDRADLIYRLAQQIEIVIRSRCAQIIRDNYTDLVLWCGRKRATDLTRCGEMLPDPVWHIWQMLDVRFWPKYDHALTLDAWHSNGKISILPIEWYDTWTEPARASLAWIYGQIASGNFDIETRNNQKMIRFTQTVKELPQVPRAKPTPKTDAVKWP